MPNAQQDRPQRYRRYPGIFLLLTFCGFIATASLIISQLQFSLVTTVMASISSPPQLMVTGFDPAPTQAGREVRIIGNGFDTGARHQNHVYFHSSAGSGLIEAQFVPGSTPTQTELRVITPYNVITGAVLVRNEAVDPTCTPCDPSCAPCAASTNPLAIETSISGIVKNASNNSGIQGVVVKVPLTDSCTTTTEEGVFTLKLPVTSLQHLPYVVDGRTAATCFPWKTLLAHIVPGGDHNIGSINLLPANPTLCNLLPGTPCVEHLSGGPGNVERKQRKAISAPGISLELQPGKTTHFYSSFVANSQSAVIRRQTGRSAQTNEKILKAGLVTLRISGAPNLDDKILNSLSLGVFPPERTPTTLPVARYSSTIVQIAPFGFRLGAGTKLTFPNKDKIPIGANARLFHLDQAEGSQTLGKFIDVGHATVSPDGQWIETDKGVVKETGDYFVSIEWDTTTIKGRLRRSDTQPGIYSLVASRGQATFSDNSGNYELKGVPIVASGAPATVEATLLRSDGKVITAERVGVPLIKGQVSIVPTIILTSRSVNTPPRINFSNLPKSRSLEARAGEIINVDFNMIDKESGRKVRFGVSGVPFAKIITSPSLRSNKYQLQLAPKVGDEGTHKLTLIAVDNLNVSSVQTILVKINKR